MKNILPLIFLAALTAVVFPVQADDHAGAEKIKVLLVDGQNNHRWVETSPVIKKILEDSGRFAVDVSTSPQGLPRAPRKPKDANDEAAMAKYEADKAAHAVKVAEIKKTSESEWAKWRPTFADYDVVVSNYNGELWPEEVQKSFEAYVAGGGGFVPIHAANNAFPQWAEYNEMIAVGGWGGRSEASGPYLRLSEDETTFIHDMTPGRGGAHGKRHEYVVTKRAAHPIVDGLPDEWMHVNDELYDRLRGPAKNVTVIASAFADESTGGSGEEEPVLMVIEYGEGKVFHTVLGDDAPAMGGLGFAETLKRGTEWAATGEVTFAPVAADVLTLDAAARGQ